MTPIVPGKRPDWWREVVEELVRGHGVKERVVVVGRRGYYRDTMGKPGQNDRGLYDDAIAVISPRYFRAFNANTDPAVAHPNMATLQPGVWDYQFGIHNRTKEKSRQYRALVQAGEVVVFRDETQLVAKGVVDERGTSMGNGLWRGWFGCNIHKGGFATVGSEGCQTIWPEQWDEFLAAVETEAREFGQLKRYDDGRESSRIPYILTAREAA